jgi:S-formylglutathione hydrolase FrmB
MTLRILTLGITALALAFCAPAPASTLETLTVPSSCVDPQRVTMSDPPAGKPSRPPALRVNVVLPDGYARGRRFPVLYLLHGLGGAYDYWLDASHGELGKAIEGLSAIVVMPEGGTTATYADSWNDGRRTPCWEHYYVEELIPEMERRFRIRLGRRWHAIGGFSSGGLGALLYGARLPSYFGQLLSFSGVISTQRREFASPVVPLAVAAVFAPTKLASIGPFFWSDAFGATPAQDFYRAAHNPVALAPGLTASRIYVAHGGATPPTCVDPVRPIEHCAVQEAIGGATEANLNGPWARDFVQAARAAGANVTYRPQRGGHFYTYSARFLAEAIRNWGVFEPVPTRPASWSYRTVSQEGRMWDLRFRFTTAPDVLETFIRDGDRLRGQGRGEVRLRTAAGCQLDATLPFDIDLRTGTCRRR